MTVLEFLRENPTFPNDFMCHSSTGIIIHYTSVSRKGNKTIQERRFSRSNLCYQDVWQEYASYTSFADKEVYAIDKKSIYVIFTEKDWLKEIRRLFPESKREYGHYFKIDENYSTVPEGVKRIKRK